MGSHISGNRKSKANRVSTGRTTTRFEPSGIQTKSACRAANSAAAAQKLNRPFLFSSGWPENFKMAGTGCCCCTTATQSLELESDAAAVAL